MAWRGGPNNKVEEIEYREKMRKALQLRKTGMSYSEIARHLGYADHTGARNLVEKAKEEMIREPFEELREMELARLDDMLRGLYPKIMRGDHNAINAGVKVMDHRAKLTGLYILESRDDGQEAAISALMQFMTNTVNAVKGNDDSSGD